MKTACGSCGASFECGAIGSVKQPCWCEKKPSLIIDNENFSCLCEACFDRALDRQNAEVLRCFRLHLSYVGTEFCGFQEQARGRTVGGELARALRLITNQDITLHVAGRTDAGVHARGQVVSFECKTRLLPRQLQLALASHLPTDMAVFRIDSMPQGFNAQRHSVGKRYVYRIYQGLVADPFVAKFALHQRSSLDLPAMDQAAKHFVGEHDFSSFRSSLCTAPHARRYVWHACVKPHQALLEIDIRGNAFCMNMVRIMVGTLLEVGSGKRKAEAISHALSAKDRKLAGITAKAHGLTLEQVYYPDDLSDALIPEGARFPRYPVTEESWGFAIDEIERSL
ncbi:MAG TPA: tRNA pseudouridine(38-40) synthase TruA [Myxococcota bacterium]|nr:tRNA pseudouridine(38-40) synthase TruA [Myxococcota bacterium]